MTEKILIIEDESEIQEMLKFAFAREGWKLIPAITGEEGIKILLEEEVNCVILDIMLPGIDGLKTLKKIREMEKCKSLPIILCTARGEETDIVAGLELGADDYVVKPYSPRVLAARIRAALRRVEVLEKAPAGEKSFFEQGEIKIDIEKHTAFLGEESLDLLATEFAILTQFMSKPDIVFTRSKLITAIRGEDYPVTDRSIDVQIAGLRKKLKNHGKMIETIRGVGYRLKT